MAGPDESARDAMFPKLDAALIARLVPLGTRRRVTAGEVIFDPGPSKRNFYVVLEGRLEIVSPSSEGEVRITIHEAGGFTGELDILSGRPSLVRARAFELFGL